MKINESVVKDFFVIVREDLTVQLKEKYNKNVILFYREFKVESRNQHIDKNDFMLFVEDYCEYPSNIHMFRYNIKMAIKEVRKYKLKTLYD